MMPLGENIKVLIRTSLALPTQPANQLQIGQRLPVTFDRVFSRAEPPEEIYSESLSGQIDSFVFSGRNVAVMCYGPSYTNKFQTTYGDPAGSKERGVAECAIEDLFRKLREEEDQAEAVTTSIKVQFVAVIQEGLHDMLSKTPQKRIRFNNQLGKCTEASQFVVGSTGEALYFLTKGKDMIARLARFKQIKDQYITSVFSLELTTRTNKATSVRSLQFATFSASEKVPAADRPHPIFSVSLSSLGLVIYALAKGNPFVPYRNSMVTIVLKNALGGNCRSVFIAHIVGSVERMEEDISTMRCASRVRQVRNKLEEPHA